YTFALLSKLAYATNDFNRDDGKTTDNQGAISTVISQLKRKERPTYSGDLQAKWLLEEIPYSRALSAQYYAEDDVGSEGYIIFNDELAIIGVRGTEPYFQSKKPPVDNTKFKIIKAASGMAAVIADK
ncbi:lipase, partial [Vibrio anguillarum]|nr:lipase [Vibrio anguillarum]